MNISKLEDNIVKGGIKEIFPLEEKNMSPFIYEHISDFEEIIGKRLADATLEKQVGRYEADLVVQFADEEGCLVIENKLGQFDHDHLGKALTYMSYLNAKTIIWICDSYYDEHIKAINKLNDITSDEYSFYAIELQLYRIGNEIKYKYNVIVKPDYQVKLLSYNSNETDVKKYNKEFYNELVKLLSNNNISITPEPRGLGYAWIRNAYKTVSMMINISSRNKEISFSFESLNENDIDSILNLFEKSKFEFEKKYGKKNNSLVKLTCKDTFKYIKKPIECVNQVANKFKDIYSLLILN